MVIRQATDIHKTLKKHAALITKPPTKGINVR